MRILNLIFAGNCCAVLKKLFKTFSIFWHQGTKKIDLNPLKKPSKSIVFWLFFYFFKPGLLTEEQAPRNSLIYFHSITHCKLLYIVLKICKIVYSVYNVSFLLSLLSTNFPSLCLCFSVSWRRVNWQLLLLFNAGESFWRKVIVPYCSVWHLLYVLK